MPNEQNKPTADAAEAMVIMEDLNKAQQRAAKAKFLEAAKEFGEEAYPLMIGMFEHVNERMTRIEDVVDDLLDEAGNMIQPELSQTIIGTLELGRMLVVEVNRLKPGQTLDDVVVKKLKQASAAFATAAEMTAEAVQEATLPEGDEEQPEETEEEETEEEEAPTDEEEGA